MATPARDSPSVDGNGNGTPGKGKQGDPNTRFFRYFQQEVTALQEQMDRLGSTAIVGGERADALDHCLAGISRLSSEVKDASSYIPGYDQRVYAEAIKALQDKLAQTKESIAPRTKFAFKTSRKNPSAVSLADAAQLEAQVRRYIPGLPSGDRSLEESAPSQDTNASVGINGHRDEETPAALSATVGSPAVSIDAHTGRHLVLSVPDSPASQPASITSLRNCVVDLFVPTIKAPPFANLTIKDVSTSLLLCGQVNGAAHVTNVENSVIVVSAQQLRMHDCKNVDVYLTCSSSPIIENCTGIRFGHIPRTFIADAILCQQTTDPNSRTAQDMWYKVEDFNWLKSEPSPNWTLLSRTTAIPEETWTNISASAPGTSLDNILKAVGIGEMVKEH